MIQQTLTNTMSVAELVPKAAPQQLEARRGDGAFAEALAGAHTVHDRRDAQATDRSRERDRSTTAAGSSDRSRAIERTQDDTRDTDPTATADAKPTSETTGRTDAVRDDASTDDDTVAVDDSGAAADADAATDAATTAAAATAAEAGAAAAADASTTPVAVLVESAVATQVETSIDTGALAVVPVTEASTRAAATAATDAAMRLAIDADADVPVAPVDGAEETATTTALATPVAEVEVDAETDALTRVVAMPTQQTEDAPTGDEVGPTRPLTSAPVAASGPNADEVAVVEVDVEAAPVSRPAATVVAERAAAQVVAAATSATDEVATGVSTDASAQLVQAAVVETDGGEAAPVVDVDTASALEASLARSAAKSAAAATDVDAVTAAADGSELDVDGAAARAAAPATSAAPPQPSAAVLSAQQLTANAQAAKAAEQAVEEGSDAAPSTKLDPLSGNQAQPLAFGRGEQVAPGVRVREGLFAGAGVQDRIDHIAEQLATRLRLSQAAGGSQVQLNLKPKELGEVTVSMQVREGVVAATVLVDKQETANVMQDNLEELKRSLEEQGLTIQEFSVDVRGEAGAGGANARTAAQLRDEAARTSAGSSSSLAGAAAVIPGLSGSLQVDPDEVHDGDVSVLA